MTDQPPEGYGYGQPQPPQPGVPRPGELLDRFLARLIDFVLLAVVETILISVLLVGTLMNRSVGLGGTGASYAANAVSVVLTTIITLGYFAFLESSRGQTVGKMVMKLRTTGPDGQNPTMEQALRRNIFTAIGIIAVVPLLGILSLPLQLVAVILIAVGINNDTVNRQGWHDHFAGETRVWKIG
jgi:uncharacterized RDD family membrane protein YckC